MAVLSVKELASLYFPHSAPRSATVQLKRWIDLNRPLCEELRAAGLVSRQRLLTPKQVELIFHYLGEP